MITAQKTRDIARFPKELEEIGNIIKDAAQNGEAGVWIHNLSDKASEVLKDGGYELTIGAERWSSPNDDRRGQTYVWWGNN